MKIDAHQHFWQPERGDYDWMPKDNATLNRSYLPDDLAPVLARHGIEGTVLVQAAASIAETDYMLQLADDNAFIKGVVGWIDFEDPTHRAHLDRFAAHPKFRGVRPMIQDIPDVNWMLRDEVQWAYGALIDLDLTFDALGFPRHLDNFLTLLTRYPDLRVVIDHCMKPQIRDHRAGRDALGHWGERMGRLGTETGAFCKLSGLVTEADGGWSLADLAPFAERVLGAFGPARIMWGSDWPVCRLQADYGDWHDVGEALCAGLSPAERAAIFGQSAARFYRLG